MGKESAKSDLRRAGALIYERRGKRGRTWMARIGSGSRRRWRSLGSALLLTRKEAEERAQRLHAGELGAPLSGLATVGDAVDDYIAARSRSQRPLSATEIACYQRDMAPLRHVRLVALCLPILRGVILRRATEQPAAARKQLARVQRVLDHAVRAGALDRNPARELPTSLLPRLRSRSRVATLDELCHVLRALQRGSQDVLSAVALLLLTMARKRELLEMDWDEVPGPVWELPAARTKSRRSVLIPLGATAATILEELRDGRARPFALAKNTLNHALARATSGLTVHDLRRSAATYCAERGVPGDVIEAALNHARAGVAGVYNRAHLLDQRREMQVMLAEAIEELLGARWWQSTRLEGKR